MGEDVPVIAAPFARIESFLALTRSLRTMTSYVYD